MDKFVREVGWVDCDTVVEGKGGRWRLCDMKTFIIFKSQRPEKIKAWPKTYLLLSEGGWLLVATGAVVVMLTVASSVLRLKDPI